MKKTYDVVELLKPIRLMEQDSDATNAEEVDTNDGKDEKSDDNKNESDNSEDKNEKEDDKKDDSEDKSADNNDQQDKKPDEKADNNNGDAAKKAIDDAKAKLAKCGNDLDNIYKNNNLASYGQEMTKTYQNGSKALWIGIGVAVAVTVAFLCIKGIIPVKKVLPKIPIIGKLFQGDKSAIKDVSGTVLGDKSMNNVSTDTNASGAGGNAQQQGDNNAQNGEQPQDNNGQAPQGSNPEQLTDKEPTIENSVQAQANAKPGDVIQRKDGSKYELNQGDIDWAKQQVQNGKGNETVDQAKQEDGGEQPNNEQNGQEQDNQEQGDTQDGVPDGTNPVPVQNTVPVGGAPQELEDAASQDASSDAPDTNVGEVTTNPINDSIVTLRLSDGTYISMAHTDKNNVNNYWIRMDTNGNACGQGTSSNFRLSGSPEFVNEMSGAIKKLNAQVSSLPLITNETMNNNQTQDNTQNNNAQSTQDQGSISQTAQNMQNATGENVGGNQNTASQGDASNQNNGNNQPDNGQNNVQNNNNANNQAQGNNQQQSGGATQSQGNSKTKLGTQYLEAEGTPFPGAPYVTVGDTFESHVGITYVYLGNKRFEMSGKGQKPTVTREFTTADLSKLS